MSKPLTAAAVQRYRPGRERRFIKDGGAHSLYLCVQATGHKSWIMRFRRPNGMIAKMVLGPVDLSGHELKGEPKVGMPLSLAGARALAASIHRSRAQGHDVAEDHKAHRRRVRTEAADREANTFGPAARAYIEDHAQKRTRNWREVARMLGLIYRGDEVEETKDGLAWRWADKPVREIDGHLIWNVIDEARRTGVPGLEARTEGPSDNRARLLLAALSSTFSWLQRQRRVEINPCRSVSRPAAARARERVLTNDEIRWFWKACEEVGEPFGQLLRVLLLTGARLREVSGMRRSELHADGTWHLPGSRTKNKRPHVVPLSPLAHEMLETVRPISGDADLVFTTTGRSTVSGFGRVKKRLDAAMLRVAREERRIAPWVLHDLRRTFVTGLAELGISPHVIELAVNHVSGTRGGIAGVYNRSELLPERKAALERWADHVAGLVEGRPSKVVPISGRRS